jgi:hypothetical protein
MCLIRQILMRLSDGGGGGKDKMTHAIISPRTQSARGSNQFESLGEVRRPPLDIYVFRVALALHIFDARSSENPKRR